MSIYSDNKAEGTCSSRVVDIAAVELARATRVDDSLADRAVAIFAAVADATRFRILEALSAQELCVCDIAEAVGASESATSHQLRLLRDRGLVAFRRDGQRAVYRLADEHVREIITIGLRHADEKRP